MDSDKSLNNSLLSVDENITIGNVSLDNTPFETIGVRIVPNAVSDINVPSSDEYQVANNDGELSGISSVALSEFITPHTYQNWLVDLKRDFQCLIIDKCNYKTREAVRNNLSVEDGKPSKEIMSEILNTIVDHLETIFTNSNPRLSQMREVSVELGHVYPAMFHRVQQKPSFDGFETAGSTSSIDTVAEKLVNRFRDRKRKCKVSAVDNDIECQEPKKKGKKKHHYGVDDQKFVGKKASASVIEVIKSTSSISDAQEREQIYSAHRKELQYQFRYVI